jgi:hypothetical protein
MVAGRILEEGSGVGGEGEHLIGEVFHGEHVMELTVHWLSGRRRPDRSCLAELAQWSVLSGPSAGRTIGYFGEVALAEGRLDFTSRVQGLSDSLQTEVADGARLFTDGFLDAATEVRR